MIRLRRIKSKIKYFFLENYHKVIVTSIILAVTVGFFHIQLIYQNRDLIYWINLVQTIFTEYKYFFLLTPIAVSYIEVFIWAVFLDTNDGSTGPSDDERRLDIRHRYRDFLFTRLLSEISKIKDRELKDKTIISMDSLIKAHEEIHEEIAKFRKDARKLFSLNEIEISLPVEELYETENEIIENRFKHIQLGEEDLKELINS